MKFRSSPHPAEFRRKENYVGLASCCLLTAKMRREPQVLDTENNARPPGPMTPDNSSGKPGEGEVKVWPIRASCQQSQACFSSY